MITRMWRGRVRTAKLADYVEVLDRTGLQHYAETPGNRGVQLLTRDLGDGTSEVVTVSWWDDLDAVVAFAGEPVDVARYYPDDDEYLLAPRAERVEHFEVTRG